MGEGAELVLHKK